MRHATHGQTAESLSCLTATTVTTATLTPLRMWVRCPVGIKKKSGRSPREGHVHHSRRQDLQWLPPEFVFPSLVCRGTETSVWYTHDRWRLFKRAERAESHTRQILFSVGASPCQKEKLSESAWQAEMGGWWQTWYRKRDEWWLEDKTKEKIANWQNDCLSISQIGSKNAEQKEN